MTDPADRSRVLRVPRRCADGKELIARTKTIAVDRTTPAGFTCLRCLRVTCYLAHYGRDAEVPDDVLDESAFCRQPPLTESPRRGKAWSRRIGSWWTKVEFASGWGFTDPDPTPELRAEREAAEHERRIVELHELELKDQRAQREQRRHDAESATAAKRSAMTAARGGVSCA
ncbi:hypothetical protein [Gordonia sp. DT101]|uniref:hypothetical protein n=1 Tax=Gordonia sp. DT101 TaxID=3416545 RepID=UPI003CE8F98A